MARPQKSGLDYFALDVVMNDEVELIEAEHGLEGFAILIKLFQKIYSEGYFYKWGEKEQILFSNRVSVDRNKVASIVSDCIKWGIFSEIMYEEHEILTSKRIQNQYVTAVYKRVNVEIIEDYLLIDVSDRSNLVLIGVSDDGNPDGSIDTDDKSAQSKVKESKVKKNIYAEFVLMTEAEHQKLTEKYGKSNTAKMIETLDNYKGSTGKEYKSDYRAILSWVAAKVIKEEPVNNQFTQETLRPLQEVGW